MLKGVFGGFALGADKIAAKCRPDPRQCVLEIKPSTSPARRQLPFEQRGVHPRLELQRSAAVRSVSQGADQQRPLGHRDRNAQLAAEIESARLGERFAQQGSEPFQIAGCDPPVWRAILGVQVRVDCIKCLPIGSEPGDSTEPFVPKAACSQIAGIKPVSSPTLRRWRMAGVIVISRCLLLTANGE